MNGIKLAELHVAKGTRPIIDDIDDLRVTFGFSNVEVVTVIVESRLRGGLKTNKPLNLICNFNEKNQLSISITFKDTFPLVPLEAVISINSDCQDQLQGFVDQLLSSPTSDGNYIRAVPLVKNILEKFDSLLAIGTDLVEPVVSTEAMPSDEAVTEVADDEQKISDDLNNTIFTCRMCRQIMFEYNELHPHTSVNYNNQKCTSYYLSEPPVHMKLFSQSDTEVASASDQSGKLVCSCKASVGHWSWASHRCSCGEWIAPVFQFVKRKLDVKKKH